MTMYRVDIEDLRSSEESGCARACDDVISRYCTVNEREGEEVVTGTAKTGTAKTATAKIGRATSFLIKLLCLLPKS